jgi:hypothetical protein
MSAHPAPSSPGRAPLGAGISRTVGGALELVVTLSDEQVETIARRAADLVGAVDAPRWLDTKAAAEYAGLKPSRVDDLKRLGKLAPAGYDGRKPMYRREDLDAYLEASA